jgi:FkbM family methyltransferase
MSAALRKSFPAARILAFEPNPITYKKLIETLKDVECIEAGAGAETGKGLLHCYASDQTSGHASMYRDVFRFYEGYGINAAADLTTFEFDIVTIDDVCRSRGIEAIDFMKIDVEGHELSVLKGAGEMLSRISIIQFEFNEGNVLSRTFMRDFYEALRDYIFFRLAPQRLIPMGPYASRHEIFQFQNVLAVRTGTPQWEALR